MPENQIAILDDLPAGQDALGFDPYIATLADIITSPKTRTPLTIGVFGSWGAGKTSLMGLVQQRLPKSYRTVWFDAWKYERETDLWRALLLQILLALRGALPEDDEKAAQRLDDLEAALYRSVEREELGGVQIDWGKVAGGVAQGALQIGLSFVPGAAALTKMVEALQEEGATDATEKLVAAIGRERSRLFIEQVRFLEQFQRQFRELVQTHILKKNLRLVVFVDDLDRCLPEKAIEVLEAIKLFLDVPGCIFLLGLDDKVIARGIEIKYRQLGLDADEDGEKRRERLLEGARYLEKIIQLPFQLPPIPSEKMESFVQGLIPEWADAEIARVFAAGLVNNPRQVKRAVNTYLLLTGLAARTDTVILPVQLAKLIALQNALPPLYDFLKEDNHRYLQVLEAYFLAQLTPQTPRAEMNKEPLPEAAPEKQDLPDALTPYLRRRGIAAVRRVLTLHPNQPIYNFGWLKSAALRSYFTLARYAEVPEVAPQEASPRADFEPEMVRIPAGPFLMGSDKNKDKKAYDDELPQHMLELPEYWIGKYPVTNRQYQVFIQESNYRPPPNWDGDQYPEGKADHPVVHVTWHDALAYCDWLREKTGKPYTLPSEAEWEKAARGPDGRIYPWGNIWDPARCNSKKGGVGGTTSVGQYSPQGDSPYGCADMAGNAREWTRSLYGRLDSKTLGVKDRFNYPYKFDDGRENLKATDDWIRVLRGGSFNSNDWGMRAAVRHRLNPYSRNGNGGFRLAISPTTLHSEGSEL